MSCNDDEVEELDDRLTTWASSPEGLLPGEQWRWWTWLWDDACMLQARYRLPLRSRWWESNVAAEALCAMAEWVRRYDGTIGGWDDPPGKLQLLYELERIADLLRRQASAVSDVPFVPDRDRQHFVGWLRDCGYEVQPADTTRPRR